MKELSSRSFAPGHWPDLFGQPSPNEHVSEGERDGQAHVVLESCVPPFVFHFSAQKFIQKAEIQFVLRVQYDVGDDIRSSVDSIGLDQAAQYTARHVFVWKLGKLSEEEEKTIIPFWG